MRKIIFWSIIIIFCFGCDMRPEYPGQPALPLFNEAYFANNGPQKVCRTLPADPNEKCYTVDLTPKDGVCVISVISHPADIVSVEEKK